MIGKSPANEGLARAAFNHICIAARDDGLVRAALDDVVPAAANYRKASRRLNPIIQPAADHRLQSAICVRLSAQDAGGKDIALDDIIEPPSNHGVRCVGLDDIQSSTAKSGGVGAWLDSISRAADNYRIICLRQVENAASNNRGKAFDCISGSPSD